MSSNQPSILDFLAEGSPPEPPASPSAESVPADLAAADGLSGLNVEEDFEIQPQLFSETAAADIVSAKKAQVFDSAVAKSSISRESVNSSTGLIRASMYFQEQTFADAKSAYLVDLDALPDSPNNFSHWISKAILELCALSPAKRRKALSRLAREKLRGKKAGEKNSAGRGITRSFLLLAEAVATLDRTLISDRKHNLVLTRSHFCEQAVLIAIEKSRERAGGKLPPAPKRLPNKPQRSSFTNNVS